jgi:hypothetical protein
MFLNRPGCCRVPEAEPEDRCLFAQFGAYETSRDPYPRRLLRCKRLCPSKSRIVNAARSRRKLDRRVGVDDGDRDTESSTPCERFEREISGVAKYDHAVETVGGSSVPTCAAVLADAVSNDQMGAFHADLKAVSVCDTDAGCRGVAGEDLLGEAGLRRVAVGHWR